MSLLLYAVAEEGTAALDDVDLRDRRLRSVAEGGLVAILGTGASHNPERTNENLWRYERIVEQLMELTPILPARFGSMFDDESAARDSLRTHRDRLLPALARVRGASEVSLRAVWRDGGDRSTEASGNPGTTYLLGRLGRLRRAGQLAVGLAPLRELARANRERLLPSDGLALLGAYLVDRQNVPDFARLVAALDRELDDVALVCTGPWPPYTFAGEVVS